VKDSREEDMTIQFPFSREGNFNTSLLTNLPWFLKISSLRTSKKFMVDKPSSASPAGKKR